MCILQKSRFAHFTPEVVSQMQCSSQCRRRENLSALRFSGVLREDFDRSRHITRSAESKQSRYQRQIGRRLSYFGATLWDSLNELTAPFFPGQWSARLYWPTLFLGVFFAVSNSAISFLKSSRSRSAARSESVFMPCILEAGSDGLLEPFHGDAGLSSLAARFGDSRMHARGVVKHLRGIGATFGLERLSFLKELECLRVPADGGVADGSRDHAAERVGVVGPSLAF